MILIFDKYQAYVFKTQYKYDSFGRMRNIIYPDGEVVYYGYTTGGMLKYVAGKKERQQNIYLWDREYDEQGRTTFQQYGNGVRTEYTYDPNRQWLNQLQTELSSGEALQNLQYSYDLVGNIMVIDQSASSPSGAKLGGPYANHYAYDQQYRLTQSYGKGDFPYSFNAAYSPSGRLGTKYTGAQAIKSDLLFGYDQMHNTHQPRTMFDPQVGTLEFYWDANGNLAQMIGCKQNSGRLHEWDEENRLRFVLGDSFAGYYGYDGNGERVYKLTGTSSIGQINSGSTKAQAIFDDAVMYPNPYVTIARNGYTKHYYAGTERLATVIGGGGFDDMIPAIDNNTKRHEQDVAKAFDAQYQQKNPFYFQDKVTGNTVATEDIKHQQHKELEYQCKPTYLDYVDVQLMQDILLKPISVYEQIYSKTEDVYFSHGDHLGSANWITDGQGKPIQYIHYAPYGELIDNQQAAGYDERYKFTGKERDWETGYDYFGARYWWLAGTWLSVDPLADKYPNISPYAYAAWNPVKYIDPDGRGPKDRVILARELAEQKIPYNQDKGYYLRTATSPEALATMDCSEFVCRVMAGDGITSTIESHSTRDMLANMMSDETKFIKSDIPQAGDIVLWAGHTGIIEGYNEKDNTVTVLHATRYEKNDGTIVSSTRRENYSLNYYRGKNAFFYRPVNETPDVFEDSSTAKLQEIIVKPSKDDQNANY